MNVHLDAPWHRHPANAQVGVPRVSARAWWAHRAATAVEVLSDAFEALSVHLEAVCIRLWRVR